MYLYDNGVLLSSLLFCRLWIKNSVFEVRSYFWHPAHSCCYLSWQAAPSHMERLKWSVVQRLQKAARLIRKAGEGGDKKELQHRQMHHRSLQLIKSLSLCFFLSLYISICQIGSLDSCPVLRCCPSIHFCVSFDVLCFHSYPITQSSALSIKPLHSISLSLHITDFIFNQIWRAGSISNMYNEPMCSSYDVNFALLYHIPTPNAKCIIWLICFFGFLCVFGQFMWANYAMIV